MPTITDPSTEPAPDPRPTWSRSASLTRCTEHGLVGGVAAGLAEHLDLDPLVVRLILVALAATGGLGLPVYLAAWLLIPADGEDASIAERVAGRRLR